MSGNITESIIKEAVLDRLKGLGLGVLSGPVIPPGGPAAELLDYKQGFLFDWLQTKLEDLYPHISAEGWQALLPPKLRSGVLRVSAGAARLVEAVC